MAAIHAALQGSTASLVPVRRALLSVSDKTDLEDLGRFLASKGVEILSTGGTAKRLRSAGLEVVDVSTYTGSPEMLNGRVKSLHPKIHGGILAVRGNAEHEADMETHGLGYIDMVVVNLYPFEDAVAGGGTFSQCMENVDIGGPCMLRASAKNNAAVVCVTQPSQYAELMAVMEANGGSTTTELRRKFAAQAFAHSARYDAAIASYMGQQLDAASAAGGEGKAEAKRETAEVAIRTYGHQRALKYGCNPHQKPAALATVNGKALPFEILNGNPGYINLLDAANAWQLVHELQAGTGMVAAASFKHVSPAGAAVATPLTEAERAAYEVGTGELTEPALAYIRARNADPMSSFGDFAAVSAVVDVATARVLKPCFCDGIVAPGFDEEALALLRTKKKGNFIILRADPNFQPPANEYREVFGMSFMQRRNDARLATGQLDSVVTARADISDAVKRDMVVASIALKYTQSNSVGYAMNGQMVGVGAGQQSRVDCTKLAGRKVEIWALRQHPKVVGLRFKAGVRKQARINARVRYIEGDFTEIEHRTWLEQFEEAPEPLTAAEKRAYMDALEGVTLASDAFFPFRDSIDHASKYGVSYVVQPGGSVKDGDVTAACDEYNMAMAHTGLRLFHH